MRLVLVSFILYGLIPQTGSASDLSRKTSNHDTGPTMVYLPFVAGGTPPPSVLEITQAVQQPGNPVRLIADRTTYVRLDLTSDGGETGVNAYLHGKRNGQPLPGSPLPALNNPRALKDTVDRSQMNDTFNFLLPTEWDSGTVELWASAENGSGYQFLGGTVTAGFTSADPMGVTVVPIAYTCTSGGTGTTIPAGPFDYLDDYTYKVYPVPSINMSSHMPLPYSGPCYNGIPNPQYNTTDGGDWRAILDLVTDTWWDEGAPDNYYYGLLDIYCGGGCIAGLGWIGYSKAAVGWNGWGSTHSGASGTHAHEVGHNHGRRHVPGCGAGGPDPNYPYLDGSGRGIIGDGGSPNFGFDVVSPAIKPYWSYFDLMSYCSPDWVSDYTYEAFYNYDAAQTDAAQAPVEPAFLISGSLLEGDTVRLDPIFQLDLPIKIPNLGPYTLELLGEGGKVLAQYPFAMVSYQADKVGDASVSTPEHQGFRFTIPFQEGVERVRVLRGGRLLGEIQGLGAGVEPSVSEGRWVEDQGVTKVAWSGSAGLSYLVRLSFDGGSTWQVAGVDLDESVLALPIPPDSMSQAMVEILASDGVNTSRLLLP